MPKLVDDLGRTLELAAPVRRVVSTAPFLTDAIASLGAADRLVGVSEVCPAGPDGAEPTRVGPSRKPSIRDIAELRPDLVLVSVRDTPRPVVEALEAAQLRVFSFQARDLKSASRVVKSLGQILGLGKSVEERIKEANARAQSVERRVKGLRKPRVLHLLWRKPYAAVGPRTYPHDLISRAGGHNVWSQAAVDFPTTRPDEISRMDPEVILLPGSPLGFSEEDIDEVFVELGCAATLDGRVHLVPGSLLHWPGIHYAEALELLASILHP